MEWILKPHIIGNDYDWRSSASQSDNAAFRGDDDDNTKEEEVYQDLCAIQNSISNRREQVSIISTKSPVSHWILWLICIANVIFWVYFILVWTFFMKAFNPQQILWTYTITRDFLTTKKTSLFY